MENTILNEQKNISFKTISGLKSYSICEQRKQKAIETLNNFLIHDAFRALDETELMSMDITGNETEEELKEIANAIQYEMQTEN